MALYIKLTIILYIIRFWSTYICSSPFKTYDFLIATTASMVIANIIFILYPSTIERALFKVNDVASFVLNITYSLDTPVNCLPSMHCMFCFTTIYGIINSKLSYRNKLFFCLYLVLIVFSTLFIKQHVIYDVILSFIISIVCFYVSKFKVFDKLKEYLWLFFKYSFFCSYFFSIFYYSFYIIFTIN